MGMAHLQIAPCRSLPTRGLCAGSCQWVIIARRYCAWNQVIRAARWEYRRQRRAFRSFRIEELCSAPRSYPLSTAATAISVKAG